MSHCEGEGSVAINLSTLEEMREWILKGERIEPSGNHFVLTFSNDVCRMREKQMRKQSVCGYDSGRRRS